MEYAKKKGFNKFSIGAKNYWVCRNHLFKQIQKQAKVAVTATGFEPTTI